MTNEHLTKLIVEGIQDRKGKKITLVDLSDLEDVCTEGCVICLGRSTKQVVATAVLIRQSV